MKKKLMVFVLVLTGFFSLIALAEIYQSVDSNGVVTYSDQPKTDSTAIVLPQANISTTPDAPQNTKNKTESANAETTRDKTENTTDAKAANKPYVTFELRTPKDQETFQNPTEILMSVTIQPELQHGDTIQFFWDAKAVGKPSASTGTSISKTDDDTVNLTRGTHTVHAVLYNSKAEIIKTTPIVTVFVHYASINFPKQPSASPGLQ